MKIIGCHRSSGEGGGGGGAGPAAGVNPFQIFVGTFGNMSVHVSRQVCHLYRQSISSTNKILKEIAALQCENAKKILRSPRSLA